LLLNEHPKENARTERKGFAALEQARERSRAKFADAWIAADRQIGLALKREQTRERKQAEDAATWKHFVRNEHRQLQLRKEGQLARLLGAPLPGELPALLEKLASDDQRQAERGLVALMSGGKTWYKRVEDLEPEDMPARIAANRLRTTWLKERGDRWLGGGAANL
jgi:hypothetical protein